MNFTYSINLNSITVGLLAINVVLYYSWLIRRWSRAANKGQLAPEPKGAWPILGHLPLLGGSTPAHITLGAMADKYGPIFTLRLGVFPSLVVSSSEIAKECFTTNDRDVASRPKLVVAEHLGYNYAMLGFAPSGPYWREMRKITTLEFLSNRRVKLLKHIRVSEVSTLLKELHQMLNQIMKEQCYPITLVDVDDSWDESRTRSLSLRRFAALPKMCKQFNDAYDESRIKQPQNLLCLDSSVHKERPEYKHPYDIVAWNTCYVQKIFERG